MAIVVVELGAPDPGLVDAILPAVGRELGMACSRSATRLDATFAHHPERRQYHSTALLAEIKRLRGVSSDVFLGVAAVDLFIPILTFVFGEAELGAGCAVVSYYRLQQERYGLESDRNLLVDRLVKEAVHEGGHAIGLTHCDDYACVMAASHAVEWLDIKGRALCEGCRKKAGVWPAAARAR